MAIMILISTALVLLQPVFLKWILQNPDLANDYSYVKEQLNERSIFWLMIFCFVGSMFFISLPVEWVFLYYVFTGSNPFLALIVTLIGVMSARTFNFWFGHLFRKYTLKHIINKDQKFKKKFHDVQSGICFWGNFVPGFPIELFAVFVGTTKYSYRKFMMYNVLGKTIKLLLFVALSRFVMDLALFNISFYDIVRNFFQFVLNLV